MIYFFCCVLIVTVLCASTSQILRTSLDDFVVPFRAFRLFTMNLLLQTKRRDRLYFDKLQDPVPKSTPFPCDLKNTRSPIKPQSVHKLRPGDIDVIAAIGDSLTAGFGATATNSFEVILEERGKSFTIGGEGNWRKYTTLPNILKVFNPNITGYSTRTSLTIQKGSELNVAEGGAISADMPYMAKELIKRIKLNKKINIDEDWKMITVFFGANDFCFNICYLDEPLSSLEEHRRDLVKVLRLLRDNLPKTIVNLIPPPHMKILVDLKVNPLCDISHRVECPCFFGLPFQHKRSLMYRIMDQWQQIDSEVANSSEFDTDDFTVVVQPFSLNYTMPQTSPTVADERFFSADCFHFSQRMNARISNDLWNNIMEPVGAKSLDGNDLFRKFICPTDKNPYIFTRRNSYT